MSSRTFLISPVTLFAGLATLLATPLMARENEPEKWYQVEVIIFQQQDHYQEEQPRRDIQLSYPSNYLVLTDPVVPTDDKPSDSTPEPSARPLPILAPNQDSYTTDVDASPKKEQPFEMLDAPLRHMNAYATTLQRRSGYQVLFHQAWRQPGIGSAQAPWVLVRAGERYGSHFELEGSLRLVLSNYLHLETDLWLTSFTENLDQQTETLEFETLQPENQQIEEPKTEAWPTLPDYPLPETVLTSSEQQSDTQNLELPQQSLPQEAVSQQGAELPISIAGAGFSIEFPDTEGLGLLTDNSQYLITSIDQFNVNYKLKRDKVYYMDHPEWGCWCE